MKLKNSNDDKTQKLKLWPNWKTQIVTKLNSNYDKTQITSKLTQTWNVTAQIVTKLKISNYNKTQKLKMWQNLQCVKCQLRKKTALNGQTDGQLKAKFMQLSGNCNQSPLQILADGAKKPLSNPSLGAKRHLYHIEIVLLLVE